MPATMSPTSEVISWFKGENAFLSNFHPSPVMYEGLEYPTVEHAFQAAKSLSPEEREPIRMARTPTVAKRLGRRVTLRPGWDTARLQIMAMLVQQKFSSHPELRKQLLATGDAELVEGNTWNDTFWGVCRGKGQNYLGKILMQVRDQLRAAG